MVNIFAIPCFLLIKIIYSRFGGLKFNFRDRRMTELEDILGRNWWNAHFFQTFIQNLTVTTIFWARMDDKTKEIQGGLMLSLLVVSALQTFTFLWMISVSVAPNPVTEENRW